VAEQREKGKEGREKSDRTSNIERRKRAGSGESRNQELGK
jgi:hypothetical protein